MTVELWVEERDGRPAVNPVLAALVAALRARVRVPERELVDPSAELPEAILLKSSAPLALALATAAEVAGTRVLNGAGATARALDKAAVVGALAAAGLSVPETHLVDPSGNGWVAPPGEQAWVGKPVRGLHGRDVAVCDRFAAAAAGAGIRLVQRRVGEDASEVKVYAAGEKLFAGRKRFTPTSYASDEIEPIDLDAATVELVQAAGEALRLRLFGVDLRFEDGRPTIVDANPFPGYRGFPEAVPALLDELERSL